MTKRTGTRVISERAVAAGRRSVEGRQRDEKGRLLPRGASTPPPPKAEPPTPAPATTPPEDQPTPAPPFRQLRRRFPGLPARVRPDE